MFTEGFKFLPFHLHPFCFPSFPTFFHFPLLSILSLLIFFSYSSFLLSFLLYIASQTHVHIRPGFPRSYENILSFLLSLPVFLSRLNFFVIFSFFHTFSNVISSSFYSSFSSSSFDLVVAWQGFWTVNVKQQHPLEPRDLFLVPLFNISASKHTHWTSHSYEP